MRYDLIYADPPWDFITRSAKGRDRSPDQHYPIMTQERILALPVFNIVQPNSILLLWCTPPTLKLGMQVMEAWGFTYKTVGFTWFKGQKNNPDTWAMGCGYYTRHNPEYCLLGTMGKGLTRLDRGVPALVEDDPVCEEIVAPRGEHSAKPLSVRSRIERLFGTEITRLEMFARTTCPGWDSIGLDITGNDIAVDIQKIKRTTI
jgi:N6-adenosine-specific RNA methylase IME4